MTDENNEVNMEKDLDEQLELLEESKKRKLNKDAKAAFKKKIAIFGVLGVLTVLATMSVMNGVNKAVEKDVRSTEANLSTQQPKNNIPVDNVQPKASNIANAEIHGSYKVASNKKDDSDSKVSLTNTAKPDKSKIMDLKPNSMITKSESQLETDRISQKKESNKSVIEKLDNLNAPAKKATGRRKNDRKLSEERARKLKENLVGLFVPGGATLSPNYSKENEEIDLTGLIAAHTGGSLASAKQPTIVNTPLETKDRNGQVIATNNSLSSTVSPPEEDKPDLIGVKRNVTDEEVGMILMAVDSSKPSPITAQLLSPDSDLDGAKFGCDFEKGADDESIMVRCNKMVFENQTYSVNIVMLDPESRNANFADDVNHHWWKWVVFAGSAFADGYLQFVRGRTTVITADSQVDQTDAITDRGDLNRAAAFNIGRQALAPARNALSIPNTVHTDEYRPVILLFLDDLEI